MEVEVTIDGVLRTVRVQAARGGGWSVSVDDGPEQHVDGQPLGTGEWALRVGGTRHVIGTHIAGDHVDLQHAGRGWSAHAVDARKAALELGAGGGAGVVTTQMPGVIVRLLVAVGQQVAAGDSIIVVEALKMENEFKAPVGGVVQVVHVEPGQTVESGEVLITIEPDE